MQNRPYHFGKVLPSQSTGKYLRNDIKYKQNNKQLNTGQIKYRNNAHLGFKNNTKSKTRPTNTSAKTALYLLTYVFAFFHPIRVRI